MPVSIALYRTKFLPAGFLQTSSSGLPQKKDGSPGEVTASGTSARPLMSTATITKSTATPACRRCAPIAHLHRQMSLQIPLHLAR